MAGLSYTLLRYYATIVMFVGILVIRGIVVFA